jgi:hypothetical protein
MLRLSLSVLIACTALSGSLSVAQGQDTSDLSWPQTRAERSDYKETSHYQDVLAFINALQVNGAPISMKFIGASPQGRKLPLIMAARPMPANARVAHRLKKPIVCIQANIHAGEVEGKEAVLMLLRDISSGPLSALLDRLILLVLPIYNIDGNEEFGAQSQHRAHQSGPEQVGVRANGQGLDLNRDYVKLEAPETQAAMKQVFTHWDPDVFLDLHATNGTLHGYHLTYSPSLHPDIEPALLAYTRDELLTGVRKTLRKRYGLETFDYGNTPRWNFRDKAFAWYTNRPEPRYGTNYMGLRNRISILSEAMSHLPFSERVNATYRFVQVILERVAQDAERVVELTQQADLRVTRRGLDCQNAAPLGVRFDFASRGREDVRLGKTETPELREQKPRNRPPGPPKDIVKVNMEIYDRFKATRTRPYPAAYVFGPDLAHLARLLTAHGIVVEKCLEPWQGSVESFQIETVNMASREFQGHRLLTLEGTFASKTVGLPAHSYLVRTAQPLGLLLFQLLEPESLDGVVAWNLLDEQCRTNQPYPVMKCYQQIHVPAEVLGPEN